MAASPPSGLPDDGHVEPTAKRIRATLDGHVVVDTTGALLVWEHRRYPQHYVTGLPARW
ncbi:MAG: hypothetical protein ACFCVK_17205 [Acidimicrobiales bacterium]